MTTTEIADRLRAFIVKQFEIGVDEEFTDDVHIFDYGYVDSFGAVEIISFVEKDFGVKISDEDLVLNALNTVNEISALIAEKLGGGSNG